MGKIKVKLNEKHKGQSIHDGQVKSVEDKSAYTRPYPFKFLKTVFHKFYLVHSWILCPIHVKGYIFENCI